jgi:hypothetical protein
MSDLVSEPSEIRFTIEVKRAATGITETYQMTGHVVDLPNEPQPEPIETKET